MPRRSSMLLVVLLAASVPAASRGTGWTEAVANAAPRASGFHRVQVNTGPGGSNIPGDAANEPTLAADPKRPLRLVMGWRQFDSADSSFREAGYAFSRDGGRSWHFRGALVEGQFGSDPVLECDADGNFHYLSMDFVPPPNVRRPTWLYRSTDGGRTWGPPAFAHGGDKPWMAIDRTWGTGRHHVYVAWNKSLSDTPGEFFTRSLDRGTSFRPPIGMAASPFAATLAVDAGGALFLAGFDVSQGGTGPTPIAVSRSADAQDPLATPTFTHVYTNLVGNYTRGYSNYAFPNPDGHLGQVWIDVNRSPGPNGGEVYLLASVDPPGPDPLDVYFSRSSDGGLTYHRPVRVNSDPAALGSWQWFGTLSVAPNGRIDAIWNSTHDSMMPNLCALYYASSGDGGRTWSVSKRLSDLWNSHVGLPDGNLKIGDYYDMLSDDLGADVAWAATFNGEQDVYYTRIGDDDCNRNGIADLTDLSAGTSRDQDASGIPDECECPEAPVARRDVTAAGVLDGRAGFFEAMSSFGGSPWSRFLFDEGTWVRLHAVQLPGQPGYTVLPEGTRWVPRSGLLVGQSWASWYGEPTIATVVRSETVTVPAGTFAARVVEHRAGSDGLLRARLWFVSGVGVVRAFDYERGERFELGSYSLAGGSGFYPLAAGNWWSTVTTADVAEHDAPAGAPLRLAVTPNPLGAESRVTFTLPARAMADLAVFDPRGARVLTLWSGELGAGRHELRWDGRSGSGGALSPGVYFVRLGTPGASSVAKAVCLR